MSNLSFKGIHASSCHKSETEEQLKEKELCDAIRGVNGSDIIQIYPDPNPKNSGFGYSNTDIFGYGSGFGYG